MSDDTRRERLGRGPGLPKRGRSSHIIGPALSLLLLVWLIGSVPLDELWAAILDVNLSILIVAVTVASVNLWIRGLRWAVLLAPGARVSSATAASVSTIGLALNAVFPAKLGEIARVVIGSRRFGTRAVFTAATILVERLLDAAILAAFLATSVWLSDGENVSQPVSVLGFSIDADMVEGALRSILVGVLLLGTLVGSLSLRRVRKWLSSAGSRLLPSRFEGSLDGWLESVEAGVRAMREPRSALLALLLSVLVWLPLALSNWIVSFGFESFDLSLAEAFAITSISVAVSSIPSAPGAWGVFEAGALLALSAVRGAVDPAQALAYVLTIHFCQYVPTVVIGLILMLRVGEKWGSLRGDLPSDDDL